MAVVERLDLGAHPIWALPLQTNKWPEVSQNVDTTLIDGRHEIVHVRGRQGIPRTETVYVRANSSIGGAPVGPVPPGLGAVNSTQYLLQQLLELAGNRDLQPVMIQWDSGGGVIKKNAQDGWYYIAKAVPDNEEYWNAEIPVELTVVKAAPPPPARIGAGFTGGAVPSNLSGAAVNLVGLPINSTTISSLTRAGAQGSIPIVLGSVVNPVPWVPSATIADWWKGGCQVFDAMAPIATNPVPLAGGFTHANWVEVFGSEHQFIGDIVVTDGLMLFVFSPGSSNLYTAYVWQTNGTPEWQQVHTLQTLDNAGNTATLRDVTTMRIGLWWTEFELTATTSGNNAFYYRFRLARGMRGPLLDVVPESANNTQAGVLQMTLLAAPKMVFNDIAVKDNAVESGGVTPSGTYGYGAAMIASSSDQFLTGFGYQNAPAGQPQVLGSNSTAIQLGDTSGPGQSNARTYHIWAVPFTNPQNLQALAGSGTLGTGWSNIVDAGQTPPSNGTVGKCASGTLATNADTFGASFIPTPGKYNLWFRVRVTSNAGSGTEMALGLWDVTAAAFVPNGSQIYKPNQVAVTYGYLLVASGLTPTATHNMQFKAVTNATLGTDWFVDEAFLAPASDTNGLDFPQDLDQQARFERTVRLAIS